MFYIRFRRNISAETKNPTNSRRGIESQKNFPIDNVLKLNIAFYRPYITKFVSSECLAWTVGKQYPRETTQQIMLTSEWIYIISTLTGLKKNTPRFEIKYTFGYDVDNM